MRTARGHNPVRSARAARSFMSESDNPCQAQACDIQACIQRHQFQQDKCEHLVQKLYKCCANFYQERGRDARCVSCPRPDILDKKLSS